jgi:hypothetical protein
MVKIGIICEGNTELILFQSDDFLAFLQSLEIELVGIVDAQGSGNLLPHNIAGYIAALDAVGAHHIFVVTDLDENVCITKTKERIGAPGNLVTIVAVKQIEAWLMADTLALGTLLGHDVTIEFPELKVEPFTAINALLVHFRGRGIGNKRAGKIKLAKRMTEIGWSIERAANHEQCASARYFVTKLKAIALI